MLDLTGFLYITFSSCYKFLFQYIGVYIDENCEKEKRKNFPQDNFSILLRLATKMVSAPCIRIQSISYEVALSYPNTFFKSAFLASILYLTRAFSLNSSVFKILAVYAPLILSGRNSSCYWLLPCNTLSSWSNCGICRHQRNRPLYG